MDVWLSDTLRRYYVSSEAESTRALTLEAARGERLSFQVLCRTGWTDALIATQVTAPDGLAIEVRRAGYVPMSHFSRVYRPGTVIRDVSPAAADIEGWGHVPGLAPDPLFPETSVRAGLFETHAFWVTVRVSPDLAPGAYAVTAIVTGADDVQTLTVTVHVHRARLESRRDFPVTHWFYPDAFCSWYKIAPFEDAFWRLLDPYLANMATHGQDTVFVPLFNAPLESPRGRTQLLDVRRAGDTYQFDWTLVHRWVRASRAQGLTRFEWTHLFSKPGGAGALPIFEGHGVSDTPLWPEETGATSQAYRAFLAQFLPAFARFLQAEDLMEHSFFHLSDEPDGDEHLAQYRAARGLLRELAPWMKVMDALSDVRFAREGLMEIPVPQIDVALDFVNEGFPAWTYFCCGPGGRYLSRSFDTPLRKIRMSGWLFYRLRARGFLHWGYNFWCRSGSTILIDPFTVADAHQWPVWPYGDPFVVYPGSDGPIDSLRWEVFAESMQDYALLQSAWPADAPQLEEIRDYANFPREAGWIRARRSELLAALDRQCR